MDRSAATTAPFLARCVAWAGAIAAVAFALLTPPFQVPDEPAHFFRIVATSEGRLFTVRKDGRAGQDLPHWAVAWSAEVLDSIPGDVTKKVPANWLIRSSGRARADRARAFVAVPQQARIDRLGYTAAAYSPLPYLLPAAAVAAGVRAGLSPMQLLLLSRLTNATLALALVVCAVRLSGPAAPLLALTAMLPMSAFMRSSASADGIALAVSLLLIALVVRCTWRNGAAGGSELLLLAVLPLLVCATKPNLALAALPLTIPPERLGRSRNWFRAGVLAALGGGLWVASLWGRDATLAAPAVAGLGRAQIAAVMHHPVGFANALLRTWINYSPRYFEEAIGKFGWMDTPLPGPVVAFTWGLLLYVAITAGPQFTRQGRAVWWAFGGFGVFLVIITLYVTWNAPGAGVVDGMQGRYFLSLLPLLALPMSSERFRRPLDRMALVVLASCAGLVLAGSLLVLIRRFYAA